MSKFIPLWEVVSKHGADGFTMTFAEVEQVLGFPVDHAFLL